MAPSVPAHEDEPAAEPSPENEAAAVPTTVTAEPATVEPATAEPTTAEPATAEPARRGPVDQELDLTLDNPTDRALFQLGRLPTKLRTAIIHHGPCRPKGQFAIRGENGNTVEPLTNDHPHQRPSLSYDRISCDEQGILCVYESLTSDHPSYTTTPM